MYEFIKGTVDFVGPEYIVIENRGIGYQVMTPNPFVYTKEAGKEICIYTYHYFAFSGTRTFGLVEKGGCHA